MSRSQHCTFLEHKIIPHNYDPLLIFIPKIYLIRLSSQMRLKQLSSRPACSRQHAALYTELTKVSASINVNLLCQLRVFSAGQRLPHVIRKDQKVQEKWRDSYQSQMGSYTRPHRGHVHVRQLLTATCRNLQN